MHADGYFSLVLDRAASRLLLARFATLPEPIAHHVTVAYGTRDPAALPSAFSPGDVGRAFQLRVVGLASRPDLGVEAAVVALQLPDGGWIERGFTENLVPHVTLATAPGVEPVVANEALSSGWEGIEGGPVFRATLMHGFAKGFEEAG